MVKISKYLLTAILILGLLSCSKEEESNSPNGSAKNRSSSAQSTSPLIENLLPSEAVGFISINTLSPGFKDYSASPWGGYGLVKIFDAYKVQGINWKQVFEKAGARLKPNSKVEEILGSGLVYLFPEQDGQSTGGGFFETTPGVDSQKVVETISEQLKNSGKTITLAEPESNNTSVIEAEGSKQEIYLSAKDKLISISPNKKLNQDFLVGKKPKENKIFSDSNFKKATKGFGDPERRVYLGYLDLDQAFPSKIDKTPFTNLAFEGAMLENPSGIARALIRKGDPFDKLAGAPGSAAISYFTDNPLLYLDLDGSLISYLVDTSKETSSTAQKLSSIKRASLLAKPSKPGQFFIPIPELSLVVQSKTEQEAEQIKQELDQYLTIMFGEASTSAPSEKTFGDNKVKYFIHPMGIEAFLTNRGTRVFLAMSEKEINSLLGLNENSDKKIFADSLGNKIREHLVDRPTLANLYIDNNQLGILLEKVGGFIQMASPGNRDVARLINAENIRNLKKQSSFTASLERVPGELLLHYFGGKK